MVESLHPPAHPTRSPAPKDRGGSRLDPGVRRVLEHGLGADLSAVRLHTGGPTDRQLAAWGGSAATVGCDVLVATSYQPGSQAWLRVLAHEAAHAVQQAAGVGAGRRGVGVADSVWERAADAAADRVFAGLPAPVAGRAPDPARGSSYVQRFNSWEHRMLGDMTPQDLVLVATTVAGWQGIVSQQVAYFQLWQHGTQGVTVNAIHQVLPDLLVVTLDSGCLATYGELNAVGGDYAVDPAALNGLPASIMTGFLQQVRQESYNRLRELIGYLDSVNFTGAVTGYQGESSIGLLQETMAIDSFTTSLGENHYNGLLARNACHFAPFGWSRWREFSGQARVLAAQAFAATDPASKASLTQRAWVTQGYADHFIGDAFAAGHLVNKTLVMQWFLEWASEPGQSLLPVPNWGAVKQVTAANQRGLMGSALYARGYSGPSNDPQTSEEQATYAARMAATGVVAAGGDSQDVGYHNYLAFLEAAVVQLSSNQVHNYFNENSLSVTSYAHSAPFTVYGDEHLLRDGPSIAIVGGAVTASKSAIADILSTGSTAVTEQVVLDQLPSAVMTGSGPTPLLQWHSPALKAQCMQSMFGGFKSYLTIFGQTLGLVSQDQGTSGFATRWYTSLPGCGYQNVSTVFDGAHLMAGSNGNVYMLDPSSGGVLGRNDMPGRGFNEVRIASDGARGYVGTNGYALGVCLANAGTLWQTSLPSCGYNPVTMLSGPTGALYAGSAGNVYRLDPGSGSVSARNGLSGYGYHDIALDITGSTLCVGTFGYALGLDPNTLGEQWHTSLPGCGYTNVTVLAAGPWLIAGSNGYLYVLDPSNGAVKWENNLSGRGYHDVALASDGTTLYVGTSGHVLAFTASGLTQKWDVSLSSSSNAPVSLELQGPNLYVGTNGYLYQLDTATGRTAYTNSLSGYGLNPTSTCSDGKTLFTGINGYVVGVALDPT